MHIGQAWGSVLTRMAQVWAEVQSSNGKVDWWFMAVVNLLVTATVLALLWLPT